jgi:hypothetical protein
MASIIAALAISGSRKPDGSPNAGGTVYLSLISSPNSSVVAYADRDKNAAVTLINGGYVLDQAGKAALFVDTACRVRTLDSSGVAVDSFTFEPSTNAGLVEVLNAGFTGVSPTSGALVGGGRTTLDAVLTSLAGSLGGLDGLFTAGGVGSAGRTVQAKFAEVQVSVKDYGALGNGAADDTTAIQGAVNKVVSLGGGTVFFPAGTYPISAAITMTTSANISVALIGSGNAVTIVKQNNGAANGITVGTGIVAFRIADLEVRAASTSTGVALQMTSGQMLLIALDRVNLRFFAQAATGLGAKLFSNGVVLLNGVVATTGIGTSPVIQGTFDGAVIIGGVFQAASTGTTMLFEATSNTYTTCQIIGAAFAPNSTIGIDIPAGTLYALAIQGCILATPIRMNAATTTRVFKSGNFQFSSDQDGRTGLPVAVALTVNGSATPIAGIPMRISQSGGATTVTVNSPSGNPSAGEFVELMCLNSSAGAVTWTFNGVYKTSAAIAPASGSFTTVRFVFDNVSGVYREVARATAVI